MGFCQASWDRVIWGVLGWGKEFGLNGHGSGKSFVVNVRVKECVWDVNLGMVPRWVLCRVVGMYLPFGVHFYTIWYRDGSLF